MKEPKKNVYVPKKKTDYNNDIINKVEEQVIEKSTLTIDYLTVALCKRV
jgi:hypothetical protein